MTLTRFCSSLRVAINGALLEMQCGIVVEDREGQPTRVTVESAFPDKGLEVDGRALLGELVNVVVYAVGEQAIPVAAFDGRVVAAATKQPAPGTIVTHAFTVEEEREPKHERTAD